MKIKSSYVYLKDLHFHAFHGVLAQECIVGNDYVVNVRIKYPMSEAVEGDVIGGTLNYADAYHIIRCEMQHPSQLLEHVAGRIVQELERAFPKLEAIDLTLMKKNPPIGSDCDGAGVEFHFER